MLEYHGARARVRYAETDQMGVVYHANFLVWFEVGRVELMRALGVEYKKMEQEDDCHIMVADVHCRYHHPARYDEELRIRTRIAESMTSLRPKRFSNPVSESWRAWMSAASFATSRSRARRRMRQLSLRSCWEIAAA